MPRSNGIQQRGRKIPRKYEKEDAKRRVLEAIKTGRTVASAVDEAGRSIKTYELWRKEDEQFRTAIDVARATIKASGGDRDEKRQAARDMGFAEFRAKYLRTETAPHQQQWVDLIEGRDPSGLHEQQSWTLNRRNRVVVNCPPFHGKALALDTPLPTPDGWTTMGDVRAGDLVLGADGLPTEVVGKSQVWHKRTFRLTFSGGEQIVACEDHRWLVNSRWSRNETDVVTTARIAEGWLEGTARKPVYRVPVAKAAKLPEADLAVDPYVLGAWLGDGTARCGEFTVSDDDRSHLVSKLSVFGQVTQRRDKTAWHVNLLGLMRELRGLNVLRNKHVPQEYLRGSIDQRFALLQGLMDTDGSISRDGQAEFGNTNRRLVDAVVELVRSLGMKARLYEGRAMLNGKDCGPVYRVSFFPGMEPVFTLPRKRAQQRPVSRRQSWQTIVNVEEVEPVATQCIQVDNPDHLYVAGAGWIVTHNSVTISMDYVVYRICCNPNVRIKIISATQSLAAQFLYGVKHRLTHPNYKDLQLDFAPEGGFEAAADSWKQDQIYLGGDRDTAEKDPTVQALGIGGQLYGARCDLIILDDVTDLAHAGEYRKQFQYITQEVNTRVGPSGMVLCVGTRVAPVDIYSELLNADNYQTGRSPWSYLSQPAILAESDNTREWDTLWPKARVSWWEGDGICDCGMPECEHGYPLEPGEDEPWFPRWDGVHLAALRDGYDARTWALVFMQSSIPEDATFPAYAVNVAVDGTRRAGALQDRHAGDLSDLYFIGGLDPATTGQAGAVVYAVDRHSGKRYVVDAKMLKGPSPRTLKNLIKEWSLTYPIKMWSVDKTGLNTYFVQDDELRTWLTSHGIILYPHYISGNKWDPTYGIASLSPLFGSWEVRDGKPHKISDPLISLPRPDVEGVKILIQQLQVWSPEADPKKIPQDVLMALWFVEVQARKIVRASNERSNFRDSPFHSRRDIAHRGVVDLNEWRVS